MDHRPTIDDILGYNAVRTRVDRARNRHLQYQMAHQYAELEEDLRDEYEVRVRVRVREDLRDEYEASFIMITLLDDHKHTPKHS